MDWRDSDASEEETGQDQQTASRKRSSRACDQCRKTKSKCERPSGNATQCKSCALVGTPCTFLGPSYKRGPPKGYIHAIEQRWHQVESLLGAILQCPDSRVQELVNELKQDELAREIINRVDLGPYGPAGRRSQPVGATKEDFFASILRSNESGRDSSRSRRQSRVSREIVSSSQDHGLSVVPTKEWQDNLSRRLASRNSRPANSFGNPRGSSVPATQRRRLNDSTDSAYGQDWNGMYTFSQEDSDDAKDATEAIGTLSLDENQEIRYHSRVSGLPFLSRNLRTDDRIEGGIWKLPMARVWPSTRYGLASPLVDETEVRLPPYEVQDRLLALYFTYIHPVFPVIHQNQFLSEYRSRKHGGRRESPQTHQVSPGPEPTQEVSPLLLLSMFALAARFSDDEMPLPPPGKLWEAGCDYLDTARELLTKIFHCARPSTVQSLLLLGYREFGIGSMEQGWIFIGMAIRMAFDLGLNCDSSKWKIHGHDLFSPEETQTRCQIWWACVLADRYGSIYMGRPTMIKSGDFDTPLPSIDPDEDLIPWQPSHSTGIPYTPSPGRIMSVFCAVSRLAVIAGTIISRVYPVREISKVSKQTLLAESEAQLDQWYLGLPDYLQYDSNNFRRKPSTPQVLLLHIRYWGCVLLLYRAYIPNWKSGEEMTRNSPLSSKALDLAQSAASHISSLVTVYRETFTLRRTSPFLTAYPLSAAIMHILTLSLRSDTEATLGLRQCMTALKDLEFTWPSAARAWELLNGVKLADGIHTSQLLQAHGQPSDRQKRPADDAFGQEKNMNYPPRDVYDERSNGTSRHSAFENDGGVQELSTRIMAHMLGLDIPGVQSSAMYFPEYQWWPRPPVQGEPTPVSPHAPNPNPTTTSNPMATPNPMTAPSSIAAPNSMTTSSPITTINVGTPGSVMTPVNESGIDGWAYPAVHSNRIPDSYSYDFSQFGP